MNEEPAIAYTNEVPTIDAYLGLRARIAESTKNPGWDLMGQGISRERIETMLAQTRASVCAFSKGALIGCARVTGDEVYGYVQDVMVDPNHQRRGIGREIMKRLLEPFAAKPGYYMGICANATSDPLYREFGFYPKPGGPFLVARAEEIRLK